MNATDWALVLVWIAAVPQTIFIALYGCTNRWWLSWIGRALFTSSLALALLLDLSLFTYYHPSLLNETQTNLILAIVALGAILKLLAIVIDKRNKRSWWG